MSDMSTYLGNKILRWLGGNAMPTAPSDIYLALFNGDPKSGGTEVTTQVRTAGRVAITLDVPDTGTDNSMASSADVNFGNAENAVTLSYVGVYDASSGGNLLTSKQLSGGPFSVSQGTQVNFLSGDLTWTFGD